MKLRCFALLFVAQFTACASPRVAPGTDLLAGDRANVRALVLNRSSHWRVSGIEAHAAGGERLSAFTIASFFDLNQNGRFDEGEQRGSWTVSTSVPSTMLAISGQLRWGELDAVEPGRLYFDTRVVFEDGTTERRVQKAAPSES
ncbi:MAG: hypothetical protein WD226_06095 [Planctomycetota bacterium]